MVDNLDNPHDAESDDPFDIVKNLTDEQLEEAWEVEAIQWKEMGLSPKTNVAIDMFQLQCRVDILLRILLDKKIVDEDEFNNKVMRHMLAKMVTLRRDFQREMIRQELMKGIRSPTEPAKPGMFLPPGFPKV